MFRALLWKEWRELWSLLFAAAALSALSFFIIQVQQRVVKPIVWEMSFSLWLFIAVSYLPVHLFAREGDLQTAGFLLSKPVDRFRLWWFRLVICLTMILAIAVILYGTTTILEQFYQKVASYSVQKQRIIEHSVNPAIFLFSFSLLFSAAFRKVISAIAALLVFLFLFWMVWTMLWMAYSPLYLFRDLFSDDSGRLFRLFAALSPLIVFASLILFVRRDFVRRTRPYIAASYISIGVIALLATGMSTATFASDFLKVLRKVLKAQHSSLMAEATSSDGKYVFARAADAGNTSLLNIDIDRKQVKVLDNRYLPFTVAPAAASNLILYARGDFEFFSSTALVLSDFQGGDKKVLRETRRWRPGLYTGLSVWSTSGRYFGLEGLKDFMAEGLGARRREKQFIEIRNSRGNTLREWDFSVLESNDDIWPVGWDFKDRFYFRKGTHKRRGYLITLCRMGALDAEPKRIESIPEVSRFLISPDGRWIACASYGWNTQSALYLYDIEKGKSVFLSPAVSSFSWAQKGCRIAYLESPEPQMTGNIPKQVIVYEPDTQERISFPVGEELRAVGQWSPSGKHIIMTEEYKRGKAFILSLDTGNLAQIVWGSPRLYWITGDRLMWSADSKLFIADADGANQREFMVMEGDTYRFSDGGEG